MEKLKEYAGVIVAVVTVMTALTGLGVWAIHVQINPEIRRLDGRIEALSAETTGRLDRMDNRLDRMNNRFEARFDRIETQFNHIESDIQTILLRLPKRPETG